MVNRCAEDNDGLPEWFSRPTPEQRCQRCLLAESLEEVLTTYRVSRDELARWDGQGWVSFGSEWLDPLEPAEVNRAHFVRDVVRSGLGDACIAALLAQLARPMNFAPARVAYSFSLRWVQAVRSHQPEPDEAIESDLEDWLTENAGKTWAS